jgi:hypothetical protein
LKKATARRFQWFALQYSLCWKGPVSNSHHDGKRLGVGISIRKMAK